MFEVGGSKLEVGGWAAGFKEKERTTDFYDLYDLYDHKDHKNLRSNFSYQTSNFEQGHRIEKPVSLKKSIP
jgi:hypothetical protein